MNDMDKERLKNLLANVRDGKTSIDDALLSLKSLPFDDLEFAKVDHHRAIRQGQPEVIFCQGKTTEQILAIVDRLIAHHNIIMATRATRDVYEAVKTLHPSAEYNADARIIIVGKKSMEQGKGLILVITAGTSDIPVAEEAALTAETMGNRVERLFDVGVSGLHRLFAHMDKINAAKVIIAVAGMEGALPSIIGGLVDVPVIAVPTSVGYGSSFNGLSALLTMLNTCAPGITVVNIDNGFGAGYFAGMINH